MQIINNIKKVVSLLPSPILSTFSVVLAMHKIKLGYLRLVKSFYKTIYVLINWKDKFNKKLTQLGSKTFLLVYKSVSRLFFVYYKFFFIKKGELNIKKNIQINNNFYYTQYKYFGRTKITSKKVNMKKLKSKIKKVEIKEKKIVENKKLTYWEKLKLYKINKLTVIQGKFNGLSDEQEKHPAYGIKVKEEYKDEFAMMKNEGKKTIFSIYKNTFWINISRSERCKRWENKYKNTNESSWW